MPIPALLCRLFVLLLIVTFSIAGQAATRPAAIRVVLDDNYPPYVFRDSSGRIQGILKDLWDLWQERSGITVDFRPMDWGKARATMESGQADVIDTIFDTEERRNIYDFSRPYATIEVPVFFHQSIGGITDAASLRGFTVGVKDGDACIEYLLAHGVTNLKHYASYEAEVKAAIRKEIGVLCIDKPPAVYFFNREGAAGEFRHSPPLYVGEFHWAVAKGRSDLKSLIEEGFSRISADERAAIETRWQGGKLAIGIWPGAARHGGYVLLAVALVIIVLFTWNRTLRRRVVARTAQLEQANRSSRESEARYRALAELSSDWYWEQDKDFRFTSMSKPDAGQPDVGLDTFLGHSRRDAPGVVWDEPELSQLEAITAARRSFRDFEIGRIYRNGPKHYVRMSGEPIFDASGAFMGYRGVGADITERKQAESDLRAAEEQFRSLVEHSLAGIYIVQDGRFAYVNPRFAEVLGYASAAELMAVDPLATAPESDHATMLDRRRSLLEGKVPRFHYMRAAIRKDGTSIDLDVIGTIATHGGRPAIIGMVQDVSEKKRTEEQIQRYIVQLEAAFMRTVEVAATLSEMRDPYTGGHERRVAKIAVAIGEELGLDARRKEGLRVAGLLHDIGKITIPTEILAKPGKLSSIEFQLIKGHAQASYDVLKDVEFPWPVAEVALQHHERMDGSGYPRSLKGDEILFEARILAVADVIEAMSSHRPYRPGLGIEMALAEIELGRGTAYDATVADACLKLFRADGYGIPK